MAQVALRERSVPDFSYLDSASLRDTYASGADRNEMTFYVADIRCSNCVRKLESLPLSIKGLKKVNVDLVRKLARIEIDPKEASFKTAAEAIGQAGFSPLPLTPDLDDNALRKADDRLELIRLAIAGFCAGNIMSFALANYFGATGEWFRLFSWISFMLYLPVVSFVAIPFYRGAWQSLKQRRLSIDLPMAIASFTGFFFSVIELLRGREDIYFDSLSSFLFLILLSRWMQRQLQRRYLAPQTWLEGLQLNRVRRVNENGWEWSALQTLQKGDLVVVEAGETLPGDMELTDAVSHFSLAWLTGEGEAKTYLHGGLVPAGARLLSPNATLRLVRPMDETAFGQLLRKTREFSLQRVPTVQISDRLAQILLATVFFVAIVFLLAYWPISPVIAVERALALIIIACPCAMAFGTPLAIAAAMKKAQEAGVLIQDGGVFEKLKHIDTLFFDKTGTLTDTELRLKEAPASISADHQQIILSLENLSAHPLAFAFRRDLPAQDRLEVTDYKEIPGHGVEGLIAGQRYALKRVENATEMACGLYCNGMELQRFHFTAEPRPAAAETLKALRARGFKLRLLSGDQPSSARKTGLALGFRSDEIFGGLTPEDKAKHVASAPHALMIGDGVNDSLALMRADVGVAVSGGVEAAFRSAQVLLTQPSVHGVLQLIHTGERAFTLIRRNLALSLIYNLTTGTLALMGLVNPMVAAVAMPISSSIILLNTWLGSRA